MARTRTTIRRIDPWSILKFGFVANLVLLGVQLLAGTVLWYVIQRLQLIETVCELAATVGFEECGVDGGALFDTVLVLGLLGVVIQTGILVFLTFLANLIFDLTGGIVITLEDDRAPGGGEGRTRAGVGARSGGATSFSRARANSQSDGSPPVPPLGAGSGERTSTPSASGNSRTTAGDGPSTGADDDTTAGSGGGGATASTTSGSDDDTLFGRS